ncbi:uncharacterized protein LOC113576249 [Electrophorus electricus]|uniref:uncharacterized protein LOC113576249 n=1 Tax=Electrophorus electricus TaxID=8005 RepID=UPI0015D02722|nr:uncharacterized protein LOC113576249 [Electrophorus electricus]
MVMSLSPVSGSKESGLRGAALLGKTSSSIMNDIKNVTVPCLDIEYLLSAKVKLRQEGLLDSSLKTNLEFAINSMEAFPAAKRRNVSLTLEGERQLVRFMAGTPVLLYTVHLGPKGPEFHQRVQVGAHLTASCLNEGHFAGHRCKDELEGCLEQARRTLSAEAESNPSGLGELELRIVCGELHLTYSTQQPQHSLIICPRRRVYLGKALNLERLLEVKTYLEQTGAMGKGLLICFQHLLLHFGQYQEENSRVVLQSDGEMVELLSGSPDYHSTQHYIFTDGQNQAHSHRVQDMDLWEYD